MENDDYQELSPSEESNYLQEKLIQLPLIDLEAEKLFKNSNLRFLMRFNLN